MLKTKKKFILILKHSINSRWEKFYLELNNAKYNNKIDEVILNLKTNTNLAEDVLFSKKLFLY